jgi:hypothetical protein
VPIIVARPSSWEGSVKPYILGAIIIWFVCGVVGAVLLGQQRVDVPTIVGGPMSLWNGLNQPVGS